MYQVIQNIIDHNWITQNAGDQSQVYYICGALIVVLTALFGDMVYRVFSHFWRD